VDRPPSSRERRSHFVIRLQLGTTRARACDEDEWISLAAFRARSLPWVQSSSSSQRSPLLFLLGVDPERLLDLPTTTLQPPSYLSNGNRPTTRSVSFRSSLTREWMSRHSSPDFPLMRSSSAPLCAGRVGLGRDNVGDSEPATGVAASSTNPEVNTSGSAHEVGDRARSV
jgi:hypothetical protein